MRSLFYKTFFFVILLLTFFFLAPKEFSLSASCSPNGAQQCTGAGTYQQCNNGTWVSYACGTGFYCTVVGTNNVSCVSGCTQRGYSCQSSCSAGQTSQPYYCSSGTCCSGASTKKYLCNNTTYSCGISTDPSATDYTTCSQQCVPPGSAPPPPPSATSIYDCSNRDPNCPATSLPTCYPIQLYQSCSGCGFFDSPSKNSKYCAQPAPSACIPVGGDCSGNTSSCCSGSYCNPAYNERFETVKSYCAQISLPGTTGPDCSSAGGCPTAVGNLSTNPVNFVKTLFSILLGLSGGIAVLLIIISGYRLMTSQGNPERVQGAREQLTAAIIGLIFIILSFSILRFIGVDVLGIFP